MGGMLGVWCGAKEADATSPEISGQPTAAAIKFAQWAAENWREVFHATGQEDWRLHWVLDGQNAQIETGESGISFRAGPTVGKNADHAVLWTKASFAGDIRIDYKYTRTDETIRNVNIIYVQATGYGEEGYDEDIFAWNERRVVPAMREYFDHMHTYHISYAAFNTDNDVAGEDYIRARRYRPDLKGGLKGTALKNEYTRTGLFEPGVPHQITVIKKGSEFFMQIRNAEKSLLCHWTADEFPPITEGRIGLRHMWTRGAIYRDFRVARLEGD